VSVVRLFVGTRSSGPPASVNIIKEMPGSVASGTHCIIRPQMKIWCMRIACWKTTATNTHSQYVILIAFPLQERLRERASILHYKYTARLLTSSDDKHNYANEIREKTATFAVKNRRTALIIACKCGK